MPDGIKVIPSGMAFTLRTDDELEAALDAITAAEGISRQDAARQAILDKARQSSRRGEIDAVLAAELPRYEDAMTRLGQ